MLEQTVVIAGMEAERKMIANFCSKLSLDTRAVNRSAELYTQLSSACGGRNTHPSLQHPQVKVCICIDLACRQFKFSVEKSFLYKLAGIPYKHYKTALAVVESLIKVKNNISVEQLGVQFSCSGHVPKATKIHRYYVTKMNQRQQEMGHEPLDLEGALYKAAALVAAAKIRKTKCNAKEFCKTLSLSATQLDTISKDMMALKNEIEEKQVSESFAQKIEAKSDGIGTRSADVVKEDEEDKNLLWRFYPTGTLQSVYHKDFLEWKERMIKIASSP